MFSDRGLHIFGRKLNSVKRKEIFITNFEAMPAVIFGTLISGPFMTGFLLYLGAGSRLIGFLFGIASLINLAQIPFALLMQKVRNRKIWLAAAFSVQRISWLSGSVIALLVPDTWAVPVYALFFVCSLIAGAAGAVAFASLIGDIIPAAIRGRYFGIRNTMVGAIGSLALFTGGRILDLYPGETGFIVLLLICSIMIFINTPIIMMYPNATFETSKESQSLKLLSKPLRDRPYMRSTLFISMYLFVFFITFPMFSYVMLDVIKLSYSWVSIILVIHTIAIMIGNYVWGNLNSKYSNQTLLFYSLPFLAMGCILWGGQIILPAVAVMIASHVILGFGLGGFNQLVFNYVIGDTPKTERPMYIAIFSSSTGLFAFFGPLLGGFLYQWVKQAPNWLELYGIPVFIGLILLIYGFVTGRRVLQV